MRSNGAPLLLVLLLTGCPETVTGTGATTTGTGTTTATTTGATTSTTSTTSTAGSSPTCSAGQLRRVPGCNDVMGELCVVNPPEAGAPTCPPGTVHDGHFDQDCPQGGIACVDGCPPAPPFCVDVPAACGGAPTCA